MKQFLKGLTLVIPILLILTSYTAIAQEKDDLVYPSLEVARTLTSVPTFTNETISEVEVLPQPEEDLTVYGDGNSYMTKLVSTGSDGSITRFYQVVKDSEGNEISRIELTDQEVINEPTATTYQVGAKTQEGATFRPYFTRYGYDCGGCTRMSDGSSATASGIRVTGNSVLQADGSWKSGITYNGRYIFASSSDLPMCTLIKIDNHNYSGLGVSPDQPIYGIIADRGVGDNHLDFFVGTETNLNRVSVTGSRQPIVTITGFGEWTGRNCSF